MPRKSGFRDFEEGRRGNDVKHYIPINRTKQGSAGFWQALGLGRHHDLREQLSTGFWGWNLPQEGKAWGQAWWRVRAPPIRTALWESGWEEKEWGGMLVSEEEEVQDGFFMVRQVWELRFWGWGLNVIINRKWQSAERDTENARLTANTLMCGKELYTRGSIRKLPCGGGDK